jgi:hypothetical protein
MTTIPGAQLEKGDVLRSTPLESIKRALAGFFVVAGCNVAADAPLSTYVNVEAGSIFYAGAPASSGAISINLQTYIDPAHPKIVIAYIDINGIVQIHDGIAEDEIPIGETDWDLWKTPAPAATTMPVGVPLVEIKLDAGTTVILQTDIKSVAIPNADYAISSISNPRFWEAIDSTRVSDTQFKVPDVINVGRFDLKFYPGKIVRWLSNGAVRRTAKVISSSYANNEVTVNIVGDLFEAGANGLEYGYGDIKFKTFVIPGNVGVETSQGETFIVPYDLYLISVDAFVAVAGTTNNCVIDVNAAGTTIITTKPTIVSGTTSNIDKRCDTPYILIAKGTPITIDVDTTCVTNPQDLTVRIYYYPASWEYV